MSQLRAFFFIQIALLCLNTSLLLFYQNWNGAKSLGFGASLILLNSALSAYLWKQVLAKKLVAVAVLGIVLKYAILGICVWWAIQNPDLSAGWFVVGLSHLVIATALLVFVPTPATQRSE